MWYDGSETAGLWTTSSLWFDRKNHPTDKRLAAK